MSCVTCFLSILTTLLVMKNYGKEVRYEYFLSFTLCSNDRNANAYNRKSGLAVATPSKYIGVIPLSMTFLSIAGGTMAVAFAFMLDGRVLAVLKETAAKGTYVSSLGVASYILIVALVVEFVGMFSDLVSIIVD